jgi:Tol biopolymer transport system component
MVLLCLAVSAVTAQERGKAEPKNYKVAEVDTTGSVSPDGRFLSYVDWSTGDLAVRDLKTGENRRLTNKGSWLDSSEFAVFSTISPDGKQVAYAWFNKDDFWELRVIGVDGSEPRVLYRNREIRWIGPKEWSPDGKQILATFWRKDRSVQMVLISVDDGALRALKTFGWPHSGTMSFSPDGRYIAYDYPPQEDSRGSDIFLLSIDGSREIPLVEHPATDVLLGWAPDGQRVAFASDRTGTVDVWVIQVAEGKPQGSPELVMTDIGPNVVALGFTRQGSYYYGVENWVNDVYVATLDPATGKLQRPKKLVSHVAPDTSPDWAPDGQYLVYVSQRGPLPPGSAVYSWVLLIRSVETGKERQLPLRMRRFHAFQPRWSPDGRSLLAQGRNYKGRAGLYRIDAQTGEVTPIVQTETICPPDCIEWPAWSPDEKVIFTRWTSKGPGRTIVVRNLETSGEKELHRVASPIGVGALTVSPDSQWLVFLWEDLEKGTMALKIMPTAGGESRELARVRPPQRISALAWMPDSRHIVYAIRTTGEERKFELWQIATEGGQPQHLGLVMQGIRPYGLSIHPDGRQIAFTAGTPPRDEVWVLENFLPPPKAAQ